MIIIKNRYKCIDQLQHTCDLIDQFQRTREFSFTNIRLLSGRDNVGTVFGDTVVGYLGHMQMYQTLH